MTARGDLGDFLFARRAALDPEERGVFLDDGPRRVPGLRREELARLAGVSPSYYARLEQGHSVNASVEVLDALASALGLDADERQHVRDLGRAERGRAQRRVRRPPAEQASPAMLELLAAMPGVPSLITGRRGDVLAWNALGHALVAGHLERSAPGRPGDRPNVARLVFQDAHTRDLHVDWPGKARAAVAHLRLVAGRHPDDALLASLIGELTVACPEFARFWADRRVRACALATYELHHPVVGGLRVSQQTLRVDHAPDQGLVTFTAEAGSPSAAALQLLARACENAPA